MQMCRIWRVLYLYFNITKVGRLNVTALETFENHVFKEMISKRRARICDLPDELLLSIFQLLPVADLARCAGTCERWRRIVTGFALLWKGKRYRSFRSPTDCPETRAILHALPPLREVIIDSTNGFVLTLSYLRLHLLVKYIGVVKDCPRLKCEYLSIRVDIAGDILSHRSTVDFETLRHLTILPTSTLNTWAPRDYSADYVVRASLSLFQNLTHLCVCAEFLSGEKLDAVEEFGRLETLRLDCPGIGRLSFLRHCSDGLEELHLSGCSRLPSRELAELGRLRNLRTLRLSEYTLEERDLAVALVGLDNLQSLELNRCSPVRDLSVLRHCGRLRKLCIVDSRVIAPLSVVRPMGPQLRELRPLTAVQVRPLHAVGVRLTALSLSAALSRLERLGTDASCVAYLVPLLDCSQLRHVCCEFQCVPGLLNLRVHINVKGST